MIFHSFLAIIRFLVRLVFGIGHACEGVPFLFFLAFRVGRFSPLLFLVSLCAMLNRY